MKLNDNKRLIRLAAVITLPLVLPGCSDEIHVFRPDEDLNSLRFELRASIYQTADTRADESGFADGDRFGLFVVNFSNGQSGELTLSTNQVNNVAMTYNADANRWQSAADIYWRDAVTPADVYGYYPFNSGLSSTHAYSFEVRADQSVVGEDGEMGTYEASDFLWTKTPKAEPGKKVELTFSHMMAGVKVVLEQGKGFDGDSWTKLEKTVTVDNTVRTSEIDLSTGIVTPVGSYDRNVVMNPEGDAWRAVVVPQTVAGGKSTIGITIDGKPYAYTRTDGMTYTSGKLHTFTIRIDRKGDGGDYQLTLVGEDIMPWEADQSSHDFIENTYVAVFCPEPGLLRNVLQGNGIDFSTIRNLKITGTLNENDFWVMRDDMPSLTSVNLKDIKIKIENYIWNDDEEESELIVQEGKIPDGAFYRKTSLRRIILPEGITCIGENAFERVSFNSTVIIPESVTHILDWAFESVEEGATIVMPNNLEYIGERAFACKATIELFLSNSIKYIGKSAFYGANASGAFKIPENLQYLGEFAFSAISNQIDGEIVIPASIKELSNSVFARLKCNGGAKTTLHDGLVKIGDRGFEEVLFAPGFTLPNNLKEIGEDAFYACHFTNELVLPESIHNIGKGAFSYSNMKGTLKIPSGIEILSPTSLSDSSNKHDGCFSFTEIENVLIGDNVEIIGGCAFYGNEVLKTIEIGRNVRKIGSKAFGDCPGLQRVVCLAKEPPELYEDVFNNFDALHCHLEVPEESIDLYRTASGWRDFKFISPHRELSVGLNEQLCLNKGITRCAILYSEGEWRVKSCPSWIHVTPDHSTYKEEITFTVDPLSQGSGTREGKVMFELIGKDYTAECSFRQFDYRYPEDSQIVLQKASTEGLPVNVFIVGDGFGAEEIINGNYLERMNETMEHFFAIEPYKTYREHFNVSTSIAVSPDNKVATLQNSHLDRLNTFGVDFDARVLKDYVKRYSGIISESNIEDALIIVVSNMEGFAGTATPYEDGCALACISLSSDAYPYDQRGLIQHFAGGQAFAGLVAEYVTHNENIKGCTCRLCNALSELNELKSKGMGENVTLSARMDETPWKDFIFHPKYSSIVDMWEGGYRHYGVWRSEPQSVMGTYIAYYNTISRYAIYKAIMRRAGLPYSLEDFITNDKIELP